MFKIYTEGKKVYAQCISWKGVKLYTEGLTHWTLFDDGKEIKPKQLPTKAPKINWTAWNEFLNRKGFEIKPESKGKGTKGWIAPQTVNPELYSEQPKEAFIGSFSTLKGADLMNAKLDILEEILGDGDDISENTYTFRVLEATAHLDSQILEEQKLTGKRPQKIGWSYASNGYSGIGCSVDRFPDLTGEKQFREVSIVKTESCGCTGIPVKGITKEAPKKFAFAMITGYDSEGNIFFGNPDKLIVSCSESRDGMKRGINTANDIYYLRDLLTSEPQFAKDIAKKAGWTVQKTSKLLKRAMSVGTVKSVPLKNAKRMIHPAYFI